MMLSHTRFSAVTRPAVGRVVLVLAACSAVLFAGGCATQPRSTALAAARASAVAEYQGRFAVHYADQNGDVKDAYGNYDWVEQADAVTLSLRNPLGSTLAIVGATPTSATLELPNQAPRTASNVEELMQASLGFPMPVSGLRYWLKNQVAPNSHAKTTTDANGRISRIVQDGWQIDYLAFAEDKAPPASPDALKTNGSRPGVAANPAVVRRMNLERLHTTPDAPLSVKLVINP